MTDFLLKTFVKNFNATENPQVRESYGTFAGIVGIFVNIILFSAKFIAALCSGFAISVLADAFNNLFDACSSVVTFVGFKIAGKEQDDEHPFGHGRVEYVAGLIVSFIIIIVGIELLKEAFSKIISPVLANYSIISLIIMAVAILVKVWLGFFYKRLSKKINSATLNAAASDSFCDVIATTTVLLSLVVGILFNVNIDGYAGLVVACFVIYTGITSAKDTLSPLLGGAPDPEYVNSIEETVLYHEEIIGIHDLVIHDYGPGRKMISLHAEIPSDCNILEMHDVIDNIEMEIKRKFSCVATIHMDPIATNCEITNSIKAQIAKILSEIDNQLTFHDFRVVTGPTHTNLIFDVVTPFKFKYSDDELKDVINEKVSEMDGNYFCVLEIDKNYTSARK